MPLMKYYCDYCDKQFQDTPSARKRRLRARSLWFDSLRLSETIQAPAAGDASFTAGVCNRFVKTGFCQYGDSCKYVHPKGMASPATGAGTVAPGNIVSGSVGMAWENLPLSLRPSPDSAYGSSTLGRLGDSGSSSSEANFNLPSGTPRNSSPESCLTPEMVIGRWNRGGKEESREDTPACARTHVIQQSSRKHHSVSGEMMDSDGGGDRKRRRTRDHDLQRNDHKDEDDVSDEEKMKAFFDLIQAARGARERLFGRNTAKGDDDESRRRLKLPSVWNPAFQASDFVDDPGKDPAKVPGAETGGPSQLLEANPGKGEGKEEDDEGRMKRDGEGNDGGLNLKIYL
ncbi:hypothetical protein MLD38_015617 [Melastoma candidum]|uniref:Uncharacterized protein n=1 Tax=Melastoma candidum TaxID=119954 RepID=A0ACB9RQ54_9MYRT|nr:hypothetical protein MLD38_015617 [Melastoma candidum]